MRIDGVHLEGVGPFRKVEIAFQPRRSDRKADVHILVGPNGSGKSTILYALAAALSGPDETLGGRHAFRRMTGSDSLFAVGVGGGCVAFARGGHDSEGASIPNPFSGGLLVRKGSFDGADSWLASAGPAAAYGRLARQHLSAGSSGAPMDFAAFAYSGARALVEYHIGAIEEPSDGPLAQSLSFDRTVDAKRLAQWLSATFAKRALARERSDAEDVERFGSSLTRIEEAVAEVTGSPVRLDIDYKPRFRIVVERHGKALDLDLLPDGLKSILSWIADLLMRLDRIPWQSPGSSFERPFALFLDEIDIHLHPSWQRKILPMVQSLFPKAQIFLTTHSPFVVSSVSDAWVYPLDVDEHGEATALPPIESQAGTSFRAVLRGIFDVPEEFDQETEARFAEFYALRERVLSGESERFDDLRALGAGLASRGIEVRDIVSSELLRVRRRLEQAS